MYLFQKSQISTDVRVIYTVIITICGMVWLGIIFRYFPLLYLLKHDFHRIFLVGLPLS